VGIAGAQSYSPNPAVVRVGQQVRWQNVDAGMPHTATGSGFDTGVINSNTTSAPITFSAAGNINYVCTLHANMNGTLSVTP
jgi:plastocyanin